MAWSSQSLIKLRGNLEISHCPLHLQFACEERGKQNSTCRWQGQCFGQIFPFVLVYSCSKLAPFINLVSSLFSLLPAPAHRPYQEANDDDLERAYSKVLKVTSKLSCINLFHFIIIRFLFHFTRLSLVNNRSGIQETTTPLWTEKKLDSQIARGIF